jgi:hypothetical protein
MEMWRREGEKARSELEIRETGRAGEGTGAPTRLAEKRRNANALTYNADRGGGVQAHSVNVRYINAGPVVR